MEGEEDEAPPPAAAPELIDDPDMVTGPETGSLNEQPEAPAEEPTDDPDQGPAVGESKYYYYENGDMVRYTSDAKYYLECDIPLPSENCWTLPEDFTGSFTGRTQPGDAERVYDPETDTVFIQNQLQLLELQYESRGEDPVMSGDVDVNTFGTGMFVFTDGSRGDAALSASGGQMVTYSRGRNYVLKSSFQVVGMRDLYNSRNGRDDVGQVTKNIDGITYILIGNRQQLDAIQKDDGKDGSTTEAIKVYAASSDGTSYPGDADVNTGKNLYGVSRSGYSGAVDTGYRYRKDGNYIVFRDIDMRAYAGTQDDDLTNTDVENYPDRMAWNPLSFTGTMYGFRIEDDGTDANKAGSLFGENGVQTLINGATVDEAHRPTISYVLVKDTDPSDAEHINYSDGVVGFGFFGTIGSRTGRYIRQSKNVDYVYPDLPTTVKNLALSHVVVDMGDVESVTTGFSLISATTGIVGEVLDFILGYALDIVKNGFNRVLNGSEYGDAILSYIDLGRLLDPNASKTRENGLTAGGFAGTICGKTVVEGCVVDCVTVKTNVTVFESGDGRVGANEMSGGVIVGKGGFAGRIQGASIYGKPTDEEIPNPVLNGLVTLLSDLLYVVDGLVDVLSGILNGDGLVRFLLTDGLDLVKQLPIVGPLLTPVLALVQVLGVGLVDVLTSDYLVVGALLEALTNYIVEPLLSVIGLGDVLQLVTNNLLDLGGAIPVGYELPKVRDCTAGRVMLTTERADNGVGKYGVGGFAGEIVGAEVERCTLTDSDYLVVDAEQFGGGFAGVVRDDVMGNLLSGLGINFSSNLPAARLVKCTIEDSDVIVQGGGNLGGFIGHLSGSHVINCDVDAASRLVVESTRPVKLEENKQDCIGGFIGQVSHQSGVGLGDHTGADNDLLGNVVGLLQAVLGSDADALIDLTPPGFHAGVMGCQVHCSVDVRSEEGDYVGGMVGRSNGMLMMASTEDNLRQLKAYQNGATLPISSSEARCNVLWNLVDVEGRNYVGGVCGQAEPCKIVATLQIVQIDLSAFADEEDYLNNYRFKISDTTVRGISLDDYRGVYYVGSRSNDYAECPNAGTNDVNHTEINLASGVFDPVKEPGTRQGHDRDGYFVQGKQYVGGGFGKAMGGTVMDLALEEVAAVHGDNYVGGCVGGTAPGSTVDTENALEISLLGVIKVSISPNLLSLFADQRTRYLRVNVRGTKGDTEKDGLVVEIPETSSAVGSLNDIVVGGFAGMANSVQVDDCHVWRLNHVGAPMRRGIAGGFVGMSTIGGLAALADQETEVDALKSTLNALGLDLNQVLSLGSLLDAVPYMVPKFNGCHVGYVNNGYVRAWCAGGFAGQFQSGFVNKETKCTGDNGYVETKIQQDDKKYDAVIYTDDHQLIADCGCNVPSRAATVHSSDCTCYCCESKRGAYRYGIEKYPWSVENIGYVYGGTYAGGWGGYVLPGALASAGGGLKLLGSTLSLSNLLSVFSAYVPMIMYAGVRSVSRETDSVYPLTALETGVASVNNGFAVYAADAYSAEPRGYAGGYIGLANGAQISYSDVAYLKTGVIAHPDYLEQVNGEKYMDDANFHIGDSGEVNPLYMEYAVAGAEYAGGYVGHISLGSSASIGDSLNLLGILNVGEILSALDVVVSTVEHSDVVGAPGGFNVIASGGVKAPGNGFDSVGVAYAGGFAGRISGGHTQDSNVSNFEYIVGEIAAGGYVGEMEPGALAEVLGGDDGNGVSLLNNLVGLSDFATLLQDFVPTVRNSQTTCVPCGGAVRAESRSDSNGSVMRGMAGGYVGHLVGGQIWGFSADDWRSQGDMPEYALQTGAKDASNADVMVYVFLAPDGTTVYQLKDSYTFAQDDPLAAFSNYAYFTPDTDPATMLTDYVEYTGDPSALRVRNQDARTYRDILGIQTEVDVEADAYQSSKGPLVYKFARNDYDGLDYNTITANGIGKEDYFTVEQQADGSVSYTLYKTKTNADADPDETFEETNNTIVCQVPMYTQLPVDQRDRTNPDSVPEMKPYDNLHTYGEMPIFLRGEYVFEPQRQCAAIRIRSVYGFEYAGGYEGLMQSGSQVQAGTGGASDINILDLLGVTSFLSALEVSYSTIRFGYVNGPMRGGDRIKTDHKTYDRPQEIGEEIFTRSTAPIDYDTFQIWYEYVGQYGGQNWRDMSGLATMSSAEYATVIQNYFYGYNVRAGRGSVSTEHGDGPVAGFETNSGTSLSLAGTAGGFGGSMWSGVIHDSEGVDARNVLSMRASGGFMGEMLAKGIASVGSANALGIPLNLGEIVQLGQVLVPAVARSGITGYQRGLTVIADGYVPHSLDEAHGLGNAGGYVGASYGGQIGLLDEESDPAYYRYHPMGATKTDWLHAPGGTVWVDNLVEVQGTSAVGGFVGKSTSAATLALDLDTGTAGPLQSILSGLINSPGQLVSALDATVATIKNAVVNALPGGPTEEELAAKEQAKQNYVKQYLDERVKKYMQEHPDEFLEGEPTEEQKNKVTKEVKEQLEKEFEEQYEEEHRDDDHGLVIGGVQNVLPTCAGGFAGTLEATVIGKLDNPLVSHVVNGLRSVTAKEYAGGFFGFAGVGSVASVGGGQGTTLLNLVQAGNVGVLDVFRSYVYYSEVNGVEDGYWVTAKDYHVIDALMSNYDVTGAAGGFGGRMNNGTIEYSFANALNHVEAPNYAAGFVGFMGRSEMVDASGIEVTDNSPLGIALSALGLGAGLNLGALNVIGATVTQCGVTGYGDETDPDQVNVGFDVKTTNLQVPVGRAEMKDLTGACAAGFVGYGDLTQIEHCKVERLKLVKSQQIAAGFLGRGTAANLLDTELNSPLVNQLLEIVGYLLLNVLHLDDLANVDLVSLNAFDALGLQLLADGNLLALNLGGIRIGIKLAGVDSQGYKHILVSIGSSTVDLRVDPDGNLMKAPDDQAALGISLFEANRTTVKYSSVTGVLDGYDVHGAGYVEVDENHDGYDDDDSGKRNTNESADVADGNDGNDWGYAGGFVGYSRGSFISHNEMLYCDVIAGSKSTQMYEEAKYEVSLLKVGPFTAGYVTKANTPERNIAYFEGISSDGDRQNLYHIYRNVPEDTNARLETTNITVDGSDNDDVLKEYVRYNVQHRADASVYSDGTAPYAGVYHFSNAQAVADTSHWTYLENAKYVGGNDATSDVTLDAYISDGKAKLMLGRILEENTPHEVLPLLDINDPCYEVEITVVKEWDHGSNPEGKWPSTTKFKIYRFVTDDPSRTLFVYRKGRDDQLVWEYDMEKDTVDEVSRVDEQVTWLEHTDVPNQQTGQYIKLDQHNLNTPIFQSDGLTGELLLDDHDNPVLLDNAQSVTLYIRSENLNKYVAGENVPLYYYDGGYRRAWVYSTDKDGNLVYTDKVFDPGYSSGEIQVNGKTLTYYTDPTSVTGDTFYIDEDFHLVMYTFQEEDTLEQTHPNTVQVLFNPEDGSVMGVTETVYGNDPRILNSDNGYYTTANGKLFTVDFNKNTGLLEMDYDVADRDTEDANVKRQERIGNEVFGYNENRQLVHYRFYENDSDTTPVINLAIENANVGEDFVEIGKVGDKPYVVVYDADQNHLSLYYDVDSLKVTGDGEETPYDAYFEAEDHGNYYRMDEKTDLEFFRFRHPETEYANVGFQVNVSPEGALSEFYAVNYNGAGTPTLAGGEITPESEGIYKANGLVYTVRYDPDTRRMSVNYLPEADASGGVAYIRLLEDDNGKVTGEMYFDASGNLMKYRYIDPSDSTHYIDFVFDPGTPVLTGASETTGGSTQSLTAAAVDGDASGEKGYVLKNPTTNKYYTVRYDMQDGSVFLNIDTPGGETYYNEVMIYKNVIDETETVREEYYYNVKDELVRYKYVDTANNETVTVDIDPAADEVAFYKETAASALAANVTQSNAKRYYFKYDKASGKTTMLYDLPENYPVVFKKTEDNAEYYYNLDGDLVFYRYTNPDDNGVVELNIDPTQNVVEYYTNATSDTGKRYYFKYEKASGKATMLYDLPGEYPAVFAYSEGAASDPGAPGKYDVCYYDLSGNLVGYRYVVPGSRGWKVATGHSDGYGYDVVDFTINPSTGAITGANHYVVWEDDGTVKSNEGPVTVSNGYFVYDSKNCYAEYDKATNKMIVNYDVPIANQAYTEVKTIGDDTFTFGFNGDKELTYVHMEHDRFGTNYISEYTVDPTSGTIQEKTGGTIGNQYHILLDYNPGSKVFEVKYVEKDDTKRTVNADLTQTVDTYTVAGRLQNKQTVTYRADGTLSQYTLEAPDNDMPSLTIYFDANGDYQSFTTTDSAIHNKTNYATNVGDGNWAYEISDGKLNVRFERDVTISVTHGYSVDLVNTEVFNMATEAENLEASTEYTVPAATSAASGAVALDLTPNGAATITDYAHSPTESHQIKAAPAASGKVALDLTHNGAATPSEKDYGHTPTYTRELQDHEEELEVYIPQPEPEYQHLLKHPTPTQEHYLKYPQASNSYKLAKLTHVPEYTAATRSVYYQYGIVEDEEALQLATNGAYERVPDDEGGFQVDWDESKITIRNRYKLYDIIVDKFDANTKEKLKDAEFVLYRYEDGYGMVLDEEADEEIKNALPAVGTGERLLAVTDQEAKFWVVPDDGAYRFQISTNITGDKFLGVNDLGLLSMMKDTIGSKDYSENVQWDLVDQDNGIWYLKNRATNEYLVVKDGVFQLANAAEDVEKEIKLWVLPGDYGTDPDKQYYATRGLTTDVITGKQVILYNTAADKALHISIGGISGLSVVESVQPTFKVGVYKEDIPMLTWTGSGNSYTFKNKDGKYLAVKNNVLVYDDNAYTWTLEFYPGDGKWTIKSATDNTKALKYIKNDPDNPKANDQVFVVDTYADGDDAFRFLLFGGTTKPLTPLTVTPDASGYSKIAIYHEDDHVKVYYQRTESLDLTEWTAAKSHATVLKTDENGLAKFKYLDEGEYYLEELKPPKGYAQRKDPIGILIDRNKPDESDMDRKDDVTVDDLDTAKREVVAHVPNYRPKIVIDKFQTGDRSQKLAGAKFILYRYPTEEELLKFADLEPYEKMMQFGTLTLTEDTVLYCSQTADGEVIFCAQPQSGSDGLPTLVQVVTDSEGYAEFPINGDGVYYLKELEAPVDYRKLDKDIKVVFGDANEDKDGIIFTQPHETTVSVSIPNVPISVMPDTGGQGANWMLAASMTLLVLGGAYLIYKALRRRREEDIV